MIRFLLLFVLSGCLLAQTQLRIGVGNASNDGTGDSVRAAMQKVNTNFTTLFATVYTNGVTVTNVMRLSGSNTLTGDVIVDGNLTHDFDLNDIDGLGLDATTLNVRGVQSAYLDGGIMYLRGVTNLNIITPGVRLGTATTGQYLKLTDDIEGTVEFDAAPAPTGFTFDASRNNITLGNDSVIVDTDPGTEIVTLLGSGGSQPNRIGTSTHTIAGFVASGAIMARRTYWVDGSSGQLTYNAVAYNPGDTFVGVYGTKTYSATGNCRAKDNVTRQTDSSYTAGTAYVSSILGGYDHLNNQIAGTIAGGGHNVLRGGDGGNHATVVGGSYNTQHSGVYAFIGGGTANENRADFGTIVGGWGNWITDDNWSAADQAVILNGQEGQIQDTAYGLIGTGINNRVINPFSSTSASHNQIINGNGNIVQTMAAGLTYSTVLNGTGNTISGGSHNLAMGLNNNIYGNSGGYNVAIGSAVNIDGTGTYGFGYGATVLITNSPRAVVMGTITTITNSSDTWTFANNSTVAAANFGFTGGNFNTNNGTQYTFLMGRALSAADLASPANTADYGMAQGYQAVIRSFGQRVESNGNNTGVNVQRSRFVASRRFTHTNSVSLSSDLRLDGIDQYPYVPTNSVWQIRASVVGVQSTGAKFGTWTVDFAVRDSAGTLSILGSPSATAVHNGHSTTWTIAPAIRSSPRGVTITVTALDGETITWGASFDTMELNGAW